MHQGEQIRNKGTRLKVNEKEAGRRHKLTEHNYRAVHWWPSFSTKEEGLKECFPCDKGPLPHTPTFNLAVHSLVLNRCHVMAIKTTF